MNRHGHVLVGRLRQDFHNFKFALALSSLAPRDRVYAARRSRERSSALVYTSR